MEPNPPPAGKRPTLSVPGPRGDRRQTGDPFEREAFVLAHKRLVLIHLPERHWAMRR